MSLNPHWYIVSVKSRAGAFPGQLFIYLEVGVNFCCTRIILLYSNLCLTFLTSTCAALRIERKALIRNRYNYVTPSVQDTKGKELKQKDKWTDSFPQIGQTAIQNNKKKTIHQNRHAKTYNDRNSKI